MPQLIIKVCGLKNKENINSIIETGIDWIGLNFYDKSKRFVDPKMDIPKDNRILKVGVFVNESLESVTEINQKWELDYLQLHGDEDIEYCQNAQTINKIIKVFSIGESFDFDSTVPFSFCDFFLFDTKCKTYGGSGKKFDWQKLHEYKGSTPFLLAGGIELNDVGRIKNVHHDKLFGIDINSKFEIEAGIKNTEEVKAFSCQLKK